MDELKETANKQMPMVDYTHIAYIIGKSRRIGKILYVEFCKEGNLYYVQFKNLVSTISSSQVVNRFGTI